MISYTRWALLQLRLFYLCPSQFEKENEALDETGLVKVTVRLRFLALMAPCVLLLAIVGNLVVGTVFWTSGGEFAWKQSWFGVACGGACGLLFGGFIRAAVGVAFGVALGLMYGLVYGTGVGVPIGVPTGLVLGIANAITDGDSGDTLSNARKVVVICGVVATAGVALLGSTIFMASNAGETLIRFLLVVMLLLISYKAFHPTSRRLITVAISLVVGLAGGLSTSIAFGTAFLLSYFRLINYPVDAFLAWLCKLQLERHPLHARDLWQRHPLVWDERVWLPLPYSSVCLSALFEQDFSFALKQVAFVVAERPLQMRFCSRVIETLAVDSLRIGSKDELLRVPQRLQWLRSTPLQLSSDVMSASLLFLRAAELLLCGQESENPAVQIEMIEKAQRELNGVNYVLCQRPSKLGGQLLWHLQMWFPLLETEFRRVIALVEHNEIEQVFIFGAPIREEDASVFAGRLDIIHELRQTLVTDRHPPAVLIYGARRMGKSSILYQLPRLLGAEFAPCTLDCSNSSVNANVGALLLAVSRAITHGLDRRGIHIELLPRKTFQIDGFEVFNDWLLGVERALPHSLRMLICFDEYEKLNEGVLAGWGAGVLDYLRHMQQHHPKFVLVFAGRRTFHNLSQEWTSRFVNSRATRISFLTREEWRPVIERPVSGFTLRYMPGTMETLFAMTHGHPFLTQGVAHELVNLLNDERRIEASVADVGRASEEVILAAEEYFHDVWNDAEAEGQSLLVSRARGLRLDPSPIRAKLYEMDVLDDQGGFAVPLFERWVKRKMAAEMCDSK
ncbi:MAG: nSTAND1 domain-containing NTPase [Limisphaerales bacterium]